MPDKYYSAIKKDEILFFRTDWMQSEGIMISKTSQSPKDQCVFSLILVVNRISKSNVYEKKP